MIRLADRAPESVLPKQRNDMIDVLVRRLQVEHEWRLTLHPERQRGDECAFHALRGAATHDSEW